MNKTSARPRSLLLAEWPSLDRISWERARTPGHRLRRGGAASHLKSVTSDDLAKRYGLYLDYLHRARRLELAAAPGTQVTPANVAGYIAELRARVSSVTLYGCIYKLRRAAEIIAPSLNLAWLRELENDLAFVMQPRSKMHRLVLADVLVRAGLTLMLEAEAAQRRTPLQRATDYRNGLMIALLACCPIRLKNFAALTLGETLLQVEDSWWIALAAEQTKEGRADERRVPDFLASRIDRYVEGHRETLSRSSRSSRRVWISSNDGEPMSYLGVEEVITRTTKKMTGVAVSPHLFRTSAATTAALHAGKMPHLASSILDHRDQATTQRHYNKASSLAAGASYRSLVDSYRQ